MLADALDSEYPHGFRKSSSKTPVQRFNLVFCFLIHPYLVYGLFRHFSPLLCNAIVVQMDEDVKTSGSCLPAGPDETKKAILRFAAGGFVTRKNEISVTSC
jgi:hypothetical protein